MIEKLSEIDPLLPPVRGVRVVAKKGFVQLVEIAAMAEIHTRSRNLIAIALAALILLWPGIALSTDPADEQNAAIRRFVETYSSRRDQYRLGLASTDIGALNTGHTVIKVLKSPRESQVDSDDGFGVLAMKIVEAPRLLVWLAMIADSEELDGRFTRAVLSAGPTGSKVRYQHINLPWPFKDRHWVIQVENNVDIAHASDGAIWERRWKLHDRGEQLIDAAYRDGTITGVTQENLAKSIYLPTNRGSWTVLELEHEQTLVAAFVDLRLGGLIPDGLVRGYIKRELQNGLATLDDLIERAHMNPAGPARYHDGWGRPISIQDAVAARQAWRGKPDSGNSQESSNPQD